MMKRTIFAAAAIAVAAPMAPAAADPPPWAPAHGKRAKDAARDWWAYRNYDYNRYERGQSRYYADRYYRDGRYYRPRRLSYGDRIYHMHVKESIRVLNGRNGILGSHLLFGDPRRGWDFVSPGRGGVPFERVFRALNAVGYQGPLSVEWEDNGMNREQGAPEALAQAMIAHEGLAREFAHLLVSFVHPEGNFLDHEPLMRGAVWGIGALARKRPGAIKEAEAHLIALLSSQDAEVRALSAWALAELGGAAAVSGLTALVDDESAVRLWRERGFEETTAGEEARRALAAISGRQGG